ncbi:hypothetical protein [uncultured Novosphingobium sp.]|uniref:hypothetical protein n=1 Tax=uncultured Novosphingobium sp. TaxID=292277 RepID=UPI0025970C1C|nr:hypothetical protein [uncultured Novosphingobium sp.]
MYKITKDDLAKKTDAQLAALFQETSKGLAAKGPDLAAAQSLVCTICCELARRGAKPS